MTMSPPPELPGVLASLAPVLDRYGYLAVAGLITLEDFGVPVPGELVLVAAAVYAGAGRLDIVLVVVLAVVGAVLGDNVGYAIGYFGGRRLVERFGRYVLLTPARLGTAERFFNRHGGKIVVVARFVEGLRQANGVIAGTTGMRWRRFLGFTTLGAALWVGVWASLGYLAGTDIGAIYDRVRRYELDFLIAAAVLVVGLVVWRVLGAHRRHRGAGQR